MSDVDAACQRADDLAAVGRFGDAERVVRTALTEDPGNADLLTMLGYLLRRQERPSRRWPSATRPWRRLPSPWPRMSNAPGR